MSGVGIDLSGPVFGLTLGGGLEGDYGSLRGDVGLGLDVLATASACNGIELGLGAALQGEASGAALAFDTVGIALTGKAQAAARATGRLQVSPNIFRRFGVTAGVEAMAEAAIYGRVAVVVTVQRLVELIDEHVTEPGMARLLMIFLEEVELQGGVWAKAAFTAQASAVAEISGQLSDSHAEWSIRARASVGFKAGAGVELFLSLTAPKPLRMYRRTIDEVLGALFAAVSPHTPSHLRPRLELARLVLPCTFQVTFAAGQLPTLSTIGSADDLVSPSVRAIGDRARQWIAERAVEVGFKLLRETVEETLGVQLAQLSARQRTAIVDSLDDLATELRTGQDDEAKVLRAISGLVDALAPLAPDGLPRAVLQPLALTWAASMVALGLRDALDGVDWDFNIDVVGLNPDPLSGMEGVLRDPPSVIVTEVAEVLERPITRPMLSDAIDYLVQVADDQLFHDAVPELNEALSFLSTTFGLTPGRIITDVLTGSSSSISRTTTYRRFRDAARTAVVTFLDDIVDQVDEDEMPEEVRIWLEEAVRPVVPITSDFIFDQMDRLVDELAAGHPISWEAVSTDLQVAASRLVVKLVGFQVIVLADLVDELAREGLTAGTSELASAIEADPDGAGAYAIGALTGSLLPIPAVDLMTRAHRQRSIRLVASLLRSAGRHLGAGYALPAQRAVRRRHLRAVLEAVDGYVDPHLDAFEARIRELGECVLPVALKDPLVDYFSHELDLFGRAAPPLIVDCLNAIGDYSLDVGEQWVHAADAAVAAVLDLLESAVVTAHAAWLEASARVSQLLEQIQQALVEVDAILESIQLRFSSTALLNELVAATRAALEEAMGGFVDLSGVADLLLEAFSLFTDLLDRLTDSLIEALRSVVLTASSVARATERAWEVIREEVDAVFSLGLGLLSSDDLYQIVRRTIGVAWLETQIRALRNASREADSLEADRAAAERERSQARAARDASQARWRERRYASVPTITIISPLDLRTRPDTVYAAVTLVAETDAPLALLTGEGAVIAVLVNGSSVPIPGSAWRDVNVRVRRLRLELGPHLNAGVNTVEMAVVDGSGTPVSRKVLLLAHDPSAKPLDGALELVADRTMIDTPGDDHAETAMEQVTLRWTGRSPLDLTNWILSDDHFRHSYRFADVVLPPEGTITVVTGGDPAKDSATQVHMGRTRAIWNNRRDRIQIVDPGRVVRFEQVVPVRT